jgi:hypothetical protein
VGHDHTLAYEIKTALIYSVIISMTTITTNGIWGFFGLLFFVPSDHANFQELKGRGETVWTMTPFYVVRTT